MFSNITSAGNFGYPILLKEIRADFRKNRFFLIHLICLAIMSAGVLFSVVTHESAGSRAVPEEIGREIFNYFFWIQFSVVLLIFPAFSVLAFSEERSSLTFELLITTDLSPIETVWGKFLASSIYCLIFILATVPLLSISLLFAGVSLLEIGVAYAILIVLTVLLSMAGVFISSCFRSSVRAILVIYPISILIWGYTVYSTVIDPLFSMNQSTVVSAMTQKFFPGSTGVDWVSLMTAMVAILGGLAMGFALLLLLTANRIRPRADDRSSKLRMLLLLALVAGVAWNALGMFVEGGNQEAGFMSLLFWSAVALFVLGLIFTSEEADLPMRLRRQFAPWSGVRFPLRIFAPGPVWGLVYSMFLSVLICGGLGALWFCVFSRGGEWDRSFRECLVTLPVYLFMFFSLGFYLSTLGFTPVYCMFTIGSIFIITALLPFIFEIGDGADGVFSFYYLSPISLWNSLQPDAGKGLDDGPSFLLFGVPIIRVSQVLFPVLGFFFTVLALRRSEKSGYPLLAFRPDRPA